MRRSKAEIYFHFVWATKNRLPLLVGAQERMIIRCIESETLKLKCCIIALGGMPDHVHLLVQTPTTISPAVLAKQLKGVSSLAAEQPFAWQQGYGVFSVSRSDLSRVATYVRNQKEHHANNSTWPEWEEVDEEDPGTPGSTSRAGHNEDY